MHSVALVISMVVALAPPPKPTKTPAPVPPTKTRTPSQCQVDWANFDRLVISERTQTGGEGSQYYVRPASNEQIVILALGNQYVDPHHIDHPVPTIDDHLTVTGTRIGNGGGAKTLFSMDNVDPRNAPNRTYSVTANELGDMFGHIQIDVVYGNVSGDGHYFLRVGGPGVCKGQQWCTDEYRVIGVGGPNYSRTLSSQRIYRSNIPVPTCQP